MTGGWTKKRPGEAKNPLWPVPLERPQGRPRASGRPLAWAAPLVGRAPELSVLDDALRGAVSGAGGVVFVRRRARLGKTRLVSECRKRYMAWVGAGRAGSRCGSKGTLPLTLPLAPTGSTSSFSTPGWGSRRRRDSGRPARPWSGR